MNEEILKSLDCARISLEKINKAMDIMDEAFTEIYQRIDAMQIDLDNIKRRIL